MAYAVSRDISRPAERRCNADYTRFPRKIPSIPLGCSQATASDHKRPIAVSASTSGFGKACRSIHHVETAASSKGFGRREAYESLTCTTREDAWAVLWGFGVGALGDMAPELTGRVTWAPDDWHVWPAGAAGRCVLACTGAARKGSDPRQRMRHGFLPRCFSRMDVRQVTPGHDKVLRPAATGSAVRAVGASVRRSR